jgi:hypothetical protein
MVLLGRNGSAPTWFAREETSVNEQSPDAGAEVDGDEVQ